MERRRRRRPKRSILMRKVLAMERGVEEEEVAAEVDCPVEEDVDAVWGRVR